MKVKHETAVHCDWNVLTSPWLEVMTHYAVPDVVSPLHALTHAKEYRCITSGSPLDLFSAHRFLLTLLYWKAEVVGGVAELRSSLLAGEMPDSVVEAIKAEEGCFNLFDPEKPFLQDIAFKEDKPDSPVCALFAERASGNNAALFDHGDDRNARICLQCTTRGMMRLIPWTQSGGPGLSPSIHGAPPIMLLANGSNLLTTLGLNLLPLPGTPGHATWTGHFKPSDLSKKIPYLEALTWNARRVNLRLHSEHGTCSHCGRSSELMIGMMVFKKNSNTVKGDKDFIWQDPAAFYPLRRSTTAKKTAKDKNPSKSQRTHPPCRNSDEESTLMNKDVIKLFCNTDEYEISIIESNPSHDKWTLIIPCVETGANNKSYDHRQVVLDSFTPEALHAVTPELVEHETDKDLSGWDLPRPQDRPVLANRSRLFVNAASSLFTETDWAVFASAAFKSIAQATEAFDLFSGLYWGLRKGKQGVPRRNTGWLVLKLMASVPTAHRKQINEASFNPLDDIPRQQLNYEKKPGSVKVIYPVSFPTGNSLEQCLRDMLIRNTREQQPQLINWAGLCYSLDILLNQNTV